MKFLICPKCEHASISTLDTHQPNPTGICQKCGATFKMSELCYIYKFQEGVAFRLYLKYQKERSFIERTINSWGYDLYKKPDWKEEMEREGENEDV